MVKISVIIPVYNVCEYIEECLESVCAQTLRDIEIICVDDCGKDASMDIVRKYAQRDKRFKIITHDSNQGLAIARNSGMAAARGRYIFFLDSDDYIKPDILEKLYDKGVKNNCDVVVSKTCVFADDKTDDELLLRTNSMDDSFSLETSGEYRVSLKNFYQSISKISSVSWGKLYASEFIGSNNLRFINANIAHEDNGFHIKVLSSEPAVFVIDDIGVMYRIRTSSITAKNSIAKSIRDTRFVLEDAFLYISQKLPPDEAKKLINLTKAGYRSVFSVEFGFLFKVVWIKYHKVIKILGINFLKQYIKADRVYTKILNIPVCKQKLF
jgi:glycosyltransferase involved in cell wall biosynthesis